MNPKKKNGAIKKKLKGNNKIYFVKRLYELLNHGYTLEDSLHFLFLQYEFDESIIKEVKNDLTNGKKLSDVLKYLGYPPLIVGKMLFAENYGKIEDMLKEIEMYLLLKNEQKEKILKTIRYPLFLTLALLSLIMVFNALVIPQFENIYSSSSIKMDVKTIILIRTLYYLPKVITTLFSLTIFLLTYIIFTYKYKQNLFLKTINYIPMIRKIFKLYFSHIFTMEISLFLTSGFSLKTALELIREEKYNYYLSIFSQKVLNNLEEGVPFEETVKKIKFFEKTMDKFILHGKSNGMLDNELKLYSDLMLDTMLVAVDKKLKKLQPILFAILAIVIVGLYLVILLPIFNMTSTLK